GADLDLEILAFHRRPQIAHRRRAALAVANGILAAAKTHAAVAVVVVGDRQADLASRLDPGCEHRIARLAPLDADMPGIAAVFVAPALPAPDALKVRQPVGERPAQRALLRPTVVVARIAPRIGHHVDRRRTAEHLAPRLFDAAAVDPGVRLGVITPVMHVVL